MMVLVRGKYNTAKVFSDRVDEKALSQIRDLCDQEHAMGSIIRIMPDVHAGAGCTIGTTMTIRDNVVPNLVGVDIGCGMETIRLKNKYVDLRKLDDFIHQGIPAGFHVRKNPHPAGETCRIEGLLCRDRVDLGRGRLSIGTLGGGNHFIELGQNDKGDLYLVIHTGSRNLGKQTAEHYQERAFRETGKTFGKPLAVLTGQGFKDYIHDMGIIKHYADCNRRAIAGDIMKAMGLEEESRFSTIHNYIDTGSMILRKGAVSSRLGEIFLVPMNMKDGSLVCRGKSNVDWNHSAPHGAGRIMSRKQAKNLLDLSAFHASMKGIYSTTVDASTLDECAYAYRPMDEIIGNMRETAELVEVIRPLYNFKSAE